MNFVLVQSTKKMSIDDKVKSIIKDTTKVSLDNITNLYIDTRNKKDCFFETSAGLAYVLGYIRNQDLNIETTIEQHNQDAYSQIVNKKWPLKSNYSGSFSIFTYNKETSEIVICNDPIGIYPLYYYVTDTMTIISSNLILISSLTSEGIDEIGVVEKMLKGDYCNFGNRTIVENVKRLLPGELISINSKNQMTKHYDNTLYTTANKKPVKDISSDIWQTIKKEFDTCLAPYDNIGVGTSGGLDSRVLLGAIDKSKNIHCMTYQGSDQDYETKISNACADTVNASFNSYSIYKNQFPSKEKFSHYILQTEATGINEWLAIIENDTKLPDDSVMLLGDIADILTAKFIKKYRSRKAKIKTFFKYLLWNKEQPFTPTTSENFDEWKVSVKNSFIEQIDELFKQKPVSTDYESIVRGVIADLDCTFQRIQDHHIEYLELHDEIFALYTHGRIAMGKQVLLNKKRSFPLIPISAMQVAREATRIYPPRKLNFKLLDHMFRTEKDLQKLASIPTAQIPFISYKSNNLLKLVIWGIRSSLDQMLIKRQVKKKNANVKHRVLRSINWVKAYQEPDVEKNINAWFDNDYINRKDYCVNTAHSRGNFDSWPLYTFEIISLSSLNMEISLIKELQKL